MNKLNGYNKLNDILDLKEGYYIRYINLNVEKAKAKLQREGKITKIIKKNNGDYRLTIKSNFSNEWDILFSRSAIFYRTKTSKELREDKCKEWKKNLKENNPEEYKKWLETRKI